MKKWFVGIGLLVSTLCGLENKMALMVVLSPHNEPHTLYNPGDSDVPHPFAFYNDRAKDPMWDYTEASGSGSFLFDPNTNELHYAIAYSELSSRPLMMHFHKGEAGQMGPIIQTIFGEPDKTKEGLGTSAARALNGKEAPKGRAGFVSGVYKLKGNPTFNPPLSMEEEKEMLMNGGIYIDVHTYLNEAGEIRGQIVRP